MNRPLLFALSAAIALPAAALLSGNKTAQTHHADRIQRGQYLVSFGGCHDCHTPLKMTANGPVPDMALMLSGHPGGTPLPPPNLAPGPWFAATAGMTAWAGPWGVSYASNLTPDTNTGIGIWSEKMFVDSMKTGQHMGSGRPILPPMPWQNVARLQDEDLKAVFAYLRSIPAIRNPVPEPQPPPGRPNYE